VVSRFFELYSQRVWYGGEEKICWIPSKRKSFEVKSYYQVLLTPVQSTFPWKTIWKVKVPPRGILYVDGNSLINNVNSLIKRKGAQP
jgi:hypothetical protein